MISNLGPKTDLKEIEQLGKLTPEEEQKIIGLDKQIAELKIKDIPQQLKKLNQTAQDLASLSKRLHEIEERVCHEAIARIVQAVKDRTEKESAAQRFSIDQFKTGHFHETGGKVWYEFALAAKELAEAEQSGDKPYPQPDSYCLLCQQPLTNEAGNLLLRLWEFLRGEVQANLNQARASLEKERVELDQLVLDFFNDQSVSYRHLENTDKELVERVLEFLKVCQKRRELAMNLIDSSGTEQAMPEIPLSGADRINELINGLNAERVRLEKEDKQEEIVTLEKQLTMLHHREKLSQHLPEIQEYVKRQIWAQKASRIGGNTTHITAKHNALFKQLV